MTDIVVMNEKRLWIELSMRNLIKYAIGEMKYHNDLTKQYEYLMSEGTAIQKDLIDSLFKNRGIIL